MDFVVEKPPATVIFPTSGVGAGAAMVLSWDTTGIYEECDHQT